MTTQVQTQNPRERLLARMQVTEQRLRLAGISTAVLESGNGQPMVLLHGPGGYAAHWMRVMPALAAHYRVIAPDLPGHGGSDMGAAPPDAGRVLAWLDELIAQTCDSPPVLVGQLLGGAIAARFAALHGKRISRLVLVDSFGLSPFQPAPEFGVALARFAEHPAESTHDALWQHCAFDLDRLRLRMGEDWPPFRAYNLERARTPLQQQAIPILMGQFGAPAIAPADLERIGVPTALIWGRHDGATPLAVALAASKRYGWPLTIIDDANDDPAIEQPEAFLRALRAVLGASAGIAS